MRDMDDVFESLQRSDFRRRFRLRAAEREYLRRKGLGAVLMHGQRFIEERLAPADPPDDGKQTPMRNLPVFVAQHGTATCCRGCLAKWHAIPKGQPLTEEQKAYVLAVLRRWLLDQQVTRWGPCGPVPHPRQSKHRDRMPARLAESSGVSGGFFAYGPDPLPSLWVALRTGIMEEEGTEPGRVSVGPGRRVTLSASPHNARPIPAPAAQ